MMVNELGNTLGGMAAARDYRATRMTLSVYFRNGVKGTRGFCESRCALSENVDQ